MDECYFFDSYALIELYKGNKNYGAYKGIKVVTSFFQVYEIYYNLRKEFEESEINDFFKLLQNFCIELDFNLIPKAVEFRSKYKSKDLSYADCLGYIMAKELKIKFLTGDNQFRELPNVEFVK
ncbi:MAG TPA: type II toxin-antitoxin system VapC family toxin [Nanoarchaeota archaeon]|nr:type II toxin-antitoxin system VapC family toxin [Nanoarchaeota archaeon]HIH34198.1 type II toxin-antitoxin system VapC family toxin [Nanoarchaeota archaeon]HIH51426.1 type II toxin-antitoxin system VapC family toxin [Nanoarchaeota archaeon]HIH66080.1 type II toxin-antitoxin system VapC family toxin [Nanoarchaeota archaeon]